MSRSLILRVFLLKVLLLAFGVPATAQSGFAPIGARWVYETVIDFQSGYATVEAIKDTVVGSDTIRVLHYARFDVSFNSVDGYDFYLHQSGDTVYTFEFADSGDVQYFMYDLNPDSGDVWEYPKFYCLGGDTTYKVQFSVDNVFDTTIGSHNVKFIQLTNTDTSPDLQSCSYYNHIGVYNLSNLTGGFNFLLPRLDWPDICTSVPACGLKCYRHPDSTVFEQPGFNFCDLLFDTLVAAQADHSSEEISSRLINCYLANDELIVSCNQPIYSGAIEIFDPAGQVISVTQYSDGVIPRIPFYQAKGMYLVRLFDSRTESFSFQRFVKF
jgi:hypothetical protein